MADPSLLNLGWRERQIVEAVYRLGEAPVAAVRDELPDPPSYSAVRAMLGELVEKGVLKSRPEGKRYLYRPATPKEKASRSVVRNVVETFFGGRPSEAMAALLDISRDDLTADDIQQMRRLINQAEKESKK